MTEAVFITSIKKTICHCFNYTAAGLDRDILSNGQSTIMDRLNNKSGSGNHLCIENNPGGW